MTQKFNWSEYRPSKAVWFWSCAACIALPLVAGFTWGGWVTGATANEMAAKSGNDAQAQLAATLCVDRFLAAPDAALTLTKLKAESSWQRSKFIDNGGWVTFAGMDSPVRGAGTLCAAQLAEMDIPAANKAAEAAPEDKSVN